MNAESPPAELAEVADILGDWLANPPVLNSHWSGPQCIPTTWTITEERAIIYEIDIPSPGHLFLVSDTGADNGAYFWLDGVYKFGHREWGAGYLHEFIDISFGPISPGRHYIQVLLEDDGTENHYFANFYVDCFVCRNAKVNTFPPFLPEDHDLPRACEDDGNVFGEYCLLGSMCINRLREDAPRYCCRRFCDTNCYSPVTQGPDDTYCDAGTSCQPYPAEDTANPYDYPCYKCQ